MGPRLLAGWLACSLAAAPYWVPFAPVSVAFAQEGAAAGASDTEQQAREAFQRGRVHYDNGEFAQAAEAFDQAYRLSGRDVLLYNLYLAHRDANQSEQAAEALRGYLEKVEVIENRPQLEARLKALEDGIAQRKAAEQQRAEVEAQPVASDTPANDTTAPAAADESWWITPVAVAGVGALMAVGSIGTGIMAASKHKEIEDKCPTGMNCDPSLKATADQGQVLNITTDVLLFGGLAVVGTGALLFFLKRPGAAPATTETATTASARIRPDVGCSAQGCEGSLSVSF